MLLLLLAPLAPGAPAGAQPLVQGAPAPERLHELPHRSWTSMADLQATPVWAITQDAEGYLWLGVRGGLVRFDGTSFVRWDALSGEALPEQEVRALHAARDGSLWVGFGNAGGVSRIRDGAAHTFRPDDGLPGGPIWALHEDRQGTLWAGGAYGVSRFRDGGWERVGADRGIASDRVMLFQVHEDAAGELWLGTVAGLYRYRPASDTFDRVVSAGRVVRSVTSIPDGSLWVAGEPLGLRQAGPAQPAQAAGLVPELTAPLLRDRRGHLWGGFAATLLAGTPVVHRHYDHARLLLGEIVPYALIIAVAVTFRAAPGAFRRLGMTALLAAIPFQLFLTAKQMPVREGEPPHHVMSRIAGGGSCPATTPVTARERRRATRSS